MKSIDLCGVWNLRCQDGSFNEGRDVAVTVPGTVYSGLPASGLIRDPFWRENERDATGISDGGDFFSVTVSSPCYARFVELSLDGLDALFSDNYFDLAAGDSVTVTVLKNEIFTDSPAEGTVAHGLSEREFITALRSRSIADTY